MQKVHFRIVKAGEFKGELIAVLPHPTDRKGFITTYQHVGQQGPAMDEWVQLDCRPAKEGEYEDLLAELVSIGYTDLEVCPMEITAQEDDEIDPETKYYNDHATYLERHCDDYDGDDY
jgi:hypothetical protein